MSSKYSTLSPDARGHASWFLTRTNKEHQATMEHPFMRTIYAENFDKEAYAQYLAGQFLLFRELEALCSSRRAELPLSAVFDEALHRSKALERDLQFWWGEDWQQKASPPSAAADLYLEQLRADASDPWLLLCHHFLQYNAVLSGGQFLGSKVSARAASTPPTGAEFYAFDLPEGESTHARVQRYLDVMDQLDIGEDLRGRMLACMQQVYALLLKMFDEAYDLAKIEGVAYEESKGPKRKGPPPPPMAPADRAFTADELLRHDGRTAGLPILTSVLGRVYDVSGAKEFFGKGGPYEMFAGHDGTYNLAVMTLKKGTLDKFKYELEAEDKECLADWLAYFDNRYSRPVGELRDRQHPIALSDLPAATKIPFEDMDDEEEEEKSAPAAPPASRL